MIPYKNAPKRNACILLEEAENMISKVISTLELANNYHYDSEVEIEIRNLQKIKNSIEKIRRKKCSEK